MKKIISLKLPEKPSALFIGLCSHYCHHTWPQHPPVKCFHVIQLACQMFSFYPPLFYSSPGKHTFFFHLNSAHSFPACSHAQLPPAFHSQAAAGRLSLTACIACLPACRLPWLQALSGASAVSMRSSYVLETCLTASGLWSSLAVCLVTPC